MDGKTGARGECLYGGDSMGGLGRRRRRRKKKRETVFETYVCAYRRRGGGGGGGGGRKGVCSVDREKREGCAISSPKERDRVIHTYKQSSPPTHPPTMETGKGKRAQETETIK